MRRLRMYIYIYNIRALHICICFLVSGKASDQLWSDDIISDLVSRNVRHDHLLPYSTSGFLLFADECLGRRRAPYKVSSSGYIGISCLPTSTSLWPQQTNIGHFVEFSYRTSTFYSFIIQPVEMWSIRKGTPSSKASSLGSFVHFQQSTSWLPTSTLIVDG